MSRGLFYVYLDERRIDRRNGGSAKFDALMVRRSRPGDRLEDRLSGPHKSRKEAWAARKVLRPIWEVMRS